MTRGILASVVAAAFLASSCGGEAPKVNETAADFQAPEASAPTPAEFAAAAAPDASDEARDALIARLPSVTIMDGDTVRRLVVWEGDMLLTPEQAKALLASPPVDEEEARQRPELRVMRGANGRPAIWPQGRRNLTYWIDQNSFPSPQNYQAVVAAMRTAAADWENACSQCGLTLREAPSANGATFRVEYQAANVPYIAAAFFPNDPLYRRRLFIARDFFDSGFDPAGVLRHELGHVIGYRHEHIVGVPGCRYEDRQWIALTPYDAQSVMHYLCGGGGSLMMRLSDLDIGGHRQLYGS